MRELTASERALVDSKRKSTRPTVYDPSGTEGTEVSKDFEAWLILSTADQRKGAVDQIRALLDSEADQDRKDLFRMVNAAEQLSLDQQTSDLTETTASFTEWRGNLNLTGFEDVAEVGWMVQELQQGLNAVGEQEDVEHFNRLRAIAYERLRTSADSVATREGRLRALLAALTAY